MKKKYHWLNHLINFLAVILGVYLAFYMNERAKLRQDRKESYLLMQSLVNELSEDIYTYEKYQILANREQQENIAKLIELLSSGKTDNIADQISVVFQIENFAPTAATYSSMKSSGKLSLIEDLTLRKSLTNFHETVVVETERKMEYQVDFFTNELLPWAMNNLDLEEMRILNKDALVIFKNKLIIYESLIDQKVNSYETVVADSKELKQQIESVLASK